jgi:hypothetical protein
MEGEHDERSVVLEGEELEGYEMLVYSVV